MDKRFRNEIEMEKIINHDEYPLASLLVTLSRGSDPMLFDDWVTYFQLNEGLTRPESYNEAEFHAEHYFGVSRFASYESYKKTINAEMKKGSYFLPIENPHCNFDTIKAYTMKLNDLLTLPEVKKHFPNAEQVIPWLQDAEIIQSDPARELHFQEIAAIMFFSSFAESREDVIPETSALYPEMLLNFLMKRIAYFKLDHYSIDELVLVAISKDRIEFHYNGAVSWLGATKHGNAPTIIDGSTFRSLWASVNFIN